MKSLKRNATVLLLSTTALTACGGDGSGAPTPTQASSPGGIWMGTDSSTGMQVTALIAESGQMQLIRSDKAQLFGAITISSGNTISASIDGIAPFGGSFPDGSIHGTGKITGTLSARSSIQATITFTTDSGESTTSSVSLTFQSSYLTQPNVSSLSGSYTDSATGPTVTIDSGGALFAQDSSSGCVINGQINVVQGNYNLWAASVYYANCRGSSAALNGLQFSGFVSQTGNTVLIGLEDNSDKHYGLVFSMTKS